ncbi:MAG: hypothetical protein AAGM84_03685 [Pseudomonadota bacterium]
MATSLIGTAPAFADGYSTSDLGTVSNKSTCMAKAKRVLDRYKTGLGAAEVNQGNWTVFGWDLRPGDQDVLIMCSAPTSTGNDYRRALLVVYGEATREERMATRDVISAFWDAD